MKKWCCGGPATLWKVSREGDILWRKNHFAAMPDDEWSFVATAGSTLPRGAFWDHVGIFSSETVARSVEHPACRSVDVDQHGNVFAAGNWSRLLRNNNDPDYVRDVHIPDHGDIEIPGCWDEPRATRAFVARSYAPRGTLRWSWDNAPYHMPIGNLPDAPVFIGPFPGVIRGAGDGGAHLLFGPGYPSGAAAMGLFQSSVNWSTCSSNGNATSRRSIGPGESGFVFYHPIAGSSHEFTNEHRNRGRRWSGGIELIHSLELFAVSIQYRSWLYDHAGTLLHSDGIQGVETGWNPIADISAIAYSDGRGYQLGYPQGSPEFREHITAVHEEYTRAIFTNESNDFSWASYFDPALIGNGDPCTLLADDQYVALFSDANAQVGLPSMQRYFDHGRWALWRATDGEFLGFGNVGDPVPVIDGDRIPFSRSLIGWHIAGGGYLDHDGLRRWRPKMQGHINDFPVTGIHEIAIDDDENVYLATELGFLEIERL